MNNGVYRWTCKVEKFSFYTASDAAIWILVAFTVDRLIAVTLPLIKPIICASRRAVGVCVIIVVVAVSKNLHVFWTRGVEVSGRICGRPEPYRYFEQHIRPSLAFVLVSVLPFIIITVCNSVIIITLLRSHRLRSVALQQRSATSHDDLRDKPEKTSAQAQTQAAPRSAVFTQTSLMCIAASVGFVICVTPSIVLTMGRNQWKNAGGFTQSAYYASRGVAHQLACLNHAINFFLYCVTGQRFRTELVALLRRQSSSASTFEASTRRFYMEQAARRSTQTSTSFLAMRTVSLTVPNIIGDRLNDEAVDEVKDSF